MGKLSLSVERAGDGQNCSCRERLQLCVAHVFVSIITITSAQFVGAWGVLFLYVASTAKVHIRLKVGHKCSWTSKNESRLIRSVGTGTLLVPAKFGCVVPMDVPTDVLS